MQQFLNEEGDHQYCEMFIDCFLFAKQLWKMVLLTYILSSIIFFLRNNCGKWCCHVMEASPACRQWQIFTLLLSEESSLCHPV